MTPEELAVLEEQERRAGEGLTGRLQATQSGNLKGVMRS